MNNAVESLNLPATASREVFNIHNWKFTKMPLGENSRNAVLHVEAKCTVPGYEKLVNQWFANEKDIVDYGQGDEDFWVEYVNRSFHSSLIAAAARHLKEMQRTMGAHLVTQMLKGAK